MRTISLLIFLTLGVSCAAQQPKLTSHESRSTSHQPQLVFERLYFSFDSARLTPRTQAMIVANVAWLRIYADTVLFLIGHTDPTGSEDYNVALGDRRARAVAAAFMAEGVAPERIAGMVSHGETEATPNAGGAKAQRRVEMRGE